VNTPVERRKLVDYLLDHPKLMADHIVLRMDFARFVRQVCERQAAQAEAHADPMPEDVKAHLLEVLRQKRSELKNKAGVK